MIRFGDISMPRAGVAQLAARLSEEGATLLADQLGIAIDENRESFVIPPDDYEAVITLLAHDPIPGLDELRLVLLRDLARPARLTAEPE